MKQYTFVIETDRYAGNFEREFLAYLTGVQYEYYPESAEELRKQFLTEKGVLESPYEDLLEPRFDGDDEHGVNCFGIGGPGARHIYFYLAKRPPKSVLREWVRRGRQLLELPRTPEHAWWQGGLPTKLKFKLQAVTIGPTETTVL
jgi:hypothetical protein